MKYSYYIFAAGVLIMIGCSSSDITSANDIVFPAKNVSFKGQVEPLFSIACNSCHSPGNTVDLSSFVCVRATRVINQPGDTNCGLIQVIYGRGAPHPGPINIDNIRKQGLKQWVIEGAQDN